MVITDIQKQRFNKTFNALMQKAPPELKRKWDGVITWKDMNSYPEIHPDILKELTPAMLARYVDLLNKLSRGAL